MTASTPDWSVTEPSTIILRGKPNACDVAAILVALTALSAPAAAPAQHLPEDPSGPDQWADPGVMLLRQAAASTVLPNARY